MIEVTEKCFPLDLSHPHSMQILLTLDGMKSKILRGQNAKEYTTRRTYNCLKVASHLEHVQNNIKHQNKMKNIQKSHFIVNKKNKARK